MKYIFLLFLILLSLNCFSQEHLINGTVYSAETRKPVSNVKVILHLPDSKTMELTTDTSGKYFFKASGPGKFYITAEKCIKGRCAEGECYLDKKFVIDSNALKHDNSIFCDLTLMRIKPEYVLPIIYFKKNSLVIDSVHSISKLSIDSTLYCMAELLHLNPTMQFSIDGFAEAGEAEAIDLSSGRATAVKNKLLKYFSVDKQLLTKGFGEKNIKEFGGNNKAVSFVLIKI